MEPNAEDSELSSVDNHPADAATDLTTLTTEIALGELKEDEIVKIRVALKAMDEAHMENVANVARKYLLNG